MSIIRSDNFLFANPKPPQDFERRFTGTTYVDWTDTVQLNAALDINFRKNKYFWIAGVYYECDDDGVTYRAIGGPSAPTPNLQEVTDEGAVTTNSIEVQGNIAKLSVTNDGATPGNLEIDGSLGARLFLTNGDDFYSILRNNGNTGNFVNNLPNKDGQLATLDDVGAGVKVAFAAPVADANTITVAALVAATTLIMVVMDKICYNAAVDDGNKVSFTGTTLDMTNAGGVTAGGWLIIFYQ